MPTMGPTHLLEAKLIIIFKAFIGHSKRQIFGNSSGTQKWRIIGVNSSISSETQDLFSCNPSDGDEPELHNLSKLGFHDIMTEGGL